MLEDHMLFGWIQPRLCPESHLFWFPLRKLTILMVMDLTRNEIPGVWFDFGLFQLPIFSKKILQQINQ